MSLSPVVAHQRAKVAGLSRSRTSDDPDLADARRNLRASQLEDYIKRVVDAAPPLTAEQRDRLASLLRPATSAGGTDAA